MAPLNSGKACSPAKVLYISWDVLCSMNLEKMKMEFIDMAFGILESIVTVGCGGFN